MLLWNQPGILILDGNFQALLAYFLRHAII